MYILNKHSSNYYYSKFPVLKKKKPENKEQKDHTNKKILIQKKTSFKVNK